MSTPENPTPETDFAVKAGWKRVERDADGRLFLPAMRERMSALPMPPRTRSTLEALAAMRIAQRQLSLEQERWAERHDLTEGRLGLLFNLSHAPGNRMPMSAIAEVLNTSPRNVTGLVDALEKAGLVRRVPAPEDRRSVYAEITEAGLEKTRSLWQESTERSLPFAHGLSDDELAVLRDLSIRVLINARSLRSGESPNPSPEPVAHVALREGETN